MTEPSAGSMRAAKAIQKGLGVKQLGLKLDDKYLQDLAEEIDQETGLPNLIEALEQIRDLDPQAHRRDDLISYIACNALSKIDAKGES